ncbi:MAG: DUF1318 domain-containing protein [Terrimicrobiaceae bacterium]
MTKLSALSAAAVVLLAACSTPTVNLATPEPIKVDIAMRLDVYQHNKEQAKPTGTPAPSADATVARRHRMADIQTFKNSRLVGEGSNALLGIRSDTPGEYGDYVRKTVEAENTDRMALMKSEAANQKVSLVKIQEKQAELARKMAFKGEWIEVPGVSGAPEWIQKSE